MNTPNKKLFCFGLGYCAGALINILDEKEWDYCGTSRTQSNEKILFDGKNPIIDFKSLLKSTTHI